LVGKSLRRIVKTLFSRPKATNFVELEETHKLHCLLN
jgi:hypothetical protein